MPFSIPRPVTLAALVLFGLGPAAAPQAKTAGAASWRRPPSPDARQTTSRASSSATSGPRSWAAASTTSRSSSRTRRLLRRHRLGRHLEDDEQRHHVRAGLRRPAGRPRSATSRSPPPIRRSSAWAPASPTTASPPPGATASTRRSTAARPGSTWASRRPTTSAAIVVHPSNPDIVYVAALGASGGPNKERGLYKTTDGGKTWANEQVHRRRHRLRRTWRWTPRAPTRCTRPRTSAAARRSASAGGGPAAGCTRRPTAAHLDEAHEGAASEGDMGRIGLAVYRRDPRIVYALIEHAKEAASTAPRTAARPGRRCRPPTPARRTTARSASTPTTTSASGCSARHVHLRGRRQDVQAPTSSARSTATTTRSGSTPRTRTTCSSAPTAAST